MGKTRVTCTAPVNIAVVKYWGKRDETLILPTNSSLSVTLDQEQLCAKTSIEASHDFKTDQMWLNGVEQSLDSPRLQSVLKEIRRRAHKRKGASTESDTETDSLRGAKVHICSENNFPTAAGLASSAAGYACLAYALAQLYGVEGDISEIARQGSGSACRSVYGGFVEWEQGTDSDGSDSLAHQVANETHWPDLHVLVLVVSGKKKHIGSTAGMQTSVKTSDLFKHRVEHVVPDRMTDMKKAIQDKSFNTFAELTMKDSNNMHAVCLDTYPPISYMTDTSRDICRLVHAINEFYGENKVTYTFDAGPNACLYLLKENVDLVSNLVRHFFPPQDDCEQYVRGLPIHTRETPQNLINAIPLIPSQGNVQYVIHTKVGGGPKLLSEELSLLDNKGMPKKMSP